MPRWLTLALALLTFDPMLALSQDDDDEPQYLPGLIATYTDAAGHRAARIDREVQLRSGSSRPDHRLADGSSFAAQWRGRLFTIVTGKYQLHVHSAGKVRISLAGREVLAAHSNIAAWHAAEPIEVGYGYQPLVIDYEPGKLAELRLFWSGPQFALEPVPDRHLFHDPGQTPDTAFDTGRSLAVSHRCGACHSGVEIAKPLAAPSLTHLQGNLHTSWLLDTLMAAGDDAAPEVANRVRRMPYYGLSRADAEAITATLLAASQPPSERVDVRKMLAAQKPVPVAGSKGKTTKPRVTPSREQGELLVHSLGCLGCHRHGDEGSKGLFAAGDLARVGRKRPSETLFRWLDDPATINAQHRMPVFALSDLERADLVEYLSPTEPIKAVSLDAPMLERGKQLLAEHRCGACHELPEKLKRPLLTTPLTKTSRFDAGCLQHASPADRRPGWRFSTDAIHSLRTFVSSVQDTKSPSVDGALVLRERNCVGCHVRGAEPGMAPILTGVTARLPALSPRLPALQPPALTGVGDKLHDAALAAAIELKHPPRRPWLDIRMPRFKLRPEETAALVQHLIDHDRIPDRPTSAKPAVDEAALRLAAPRLVTSDGFGCTSCHKIGTSEPVKVALNAQGTDLTMLGERIRPSWFERWTRNPARIVPRMEMPAIQQPVRGTLHDNLDVQLSALWTTLNTPGFNPPQPNAVRVVRSRNGPNETEPAHVLTDVIESGKDVYLRPFVVGLTNRHNVLFDLGRGTLAAWWIGDTARQRTRGKAWYWEMGSEPLIKSVDRLLSFSLRDANGNEWQPAPFGQFAATLDEWYHDARHLVVRYRLHVQYEQSWRVLNVTQRITPWNGSDKLTGVEITSSVEGAQDHEQIMAMSHQGPLTPEPDQGLRRRFVLTLSTSLPVDQFFLHSVAVPKPKSVKLNIVPGFEAIQLPLPSDEMPTALTWRHDRTLAIASLKGRVCLVHDRDRDGLADEYEVVSDDLPAPYGIATSENDELDVITKYGLVRVSQLDRPTVRGTSTVIADGWGYTADYHDWAVGLPRDKQGRYYVGLPCQQDNRSEAAAKLRGTILRLVPQKPTRDEPRLFRLETFAAGQRFPMGLALNGLGQLFATDNQGNYNPFNELNHILPGERYGFINKREVKPGFAPAFQSAAIELPHPWTRSVNGLCFLHTPWELNKKLRRNVFGPFEGHLVGCEYNNLTLIRMSLEQIGNTYQGAAYPLGRAPEVDEPTFEGPVCCAVSPDGDLYVGNMRDSGWGGGQNTGSIVRLRPTGDWPLGIAEMRAKHDGFELTFTGAIDRAKASDPKRYHIRSYRRISTPAYGGNDVDERGERVTQAEVDATGHVVRLKLGTLREGFVYELRLDALGKDDKLLFPAEAHYTLRKVPPARD